MTIYAQLMLFEKDFSTARDRENVMAGLGEAAALCCATASKRAIPDGAKDDDRAEDP
ncbi:hypothetical protein [Mesorhizobium sp. B2-3-10]|uniref:hypothetical protein n=1 Tax=Mesorhizobium sp. B2-3-10 TaxID=2589954 RepID=UPI0015E30EE1|nr:hypothetical protein [Mesorhizobium sp. B2-3-10]